jgi:hypothetical protein
MTYALLIQQQQQVLQAKAKAAAADSNKKARRGKAVSSDELVVHEGKCMSRAMAVVLSYK